MSARLTSSSPNARRAVDERQDAALARDPAQLLGRHQVADRAREMREAQDLRSRRDGARERLDVVLLSRVRILLLDGDHREAEALALFAPRGQVARVVVRMDDDLVAGLEVETVRDQVVRLAGVAGDDDLVGRHAQELGQRRARVLLLRIEPGAVVRRRVAIDALRFRAGASRGPAGRQGRGSPRSSPPGRAASRTDRARSSRTPPRGRASRRERARGSRLLRPRRVAEERRRAADGKQPREVSS